MDMTSAFSILLGLIDAMKTRQTIKDKVTNPKIQEQIIRTESQDP